VSLPVHFAPKPPQDVTQTPNHKPVPAQRSDWQIGTTQPQSQPQPAPVTAQPQPQPAPAQPQPVPPPSPQPAAEEPARRKGVWQRFLSWWRGY
jgi:hypothetical protein